MNFTVCKLCINTSNFLKAAQSNYANKMTLWNGLLSSTRLYKPFIQLPLLAPIPNFLSYSIYRKIVGCSFVAEKASSVIIKILKVTSEYLDNYGNSSVLKIDLSTGPFALCYKCAC